MARSLAALVTTSALALALGAAPAAAQSLNIGTYSGSGCCGFSTRGYAFVAPTSFFINSLSVRGATGAVQDATIQVLRFNSPVPAYPGSSNDFTSLFFQAGSTSALVNIAVSAGDQIVVLGYANGASPYNVEGSPYASSIGGHAVTLFRAGFQDVGMAHDVWTEAGPSIGMVDMTYSLSNAAVVPEPSTVVLLGTGLAAVAAVARRRRRPTQAG